MGRLEGKIALVTGAANPRSIGWGIARALADEGADVALNDVTFVEDLEARANEIRAMGRRAAVVIGDISKPEQAEALIAHTVHDLGRLDILASNAGVIRWETFLDIQPQSLRTIMDVNVKGNVYMCRAAARQMIEQGDGGRIVITSSVQSDMQYPITPVYGASKKSMHIFVGALALELAPHNITVNHIGPGWVRSALNDPSPGLRTDADIEAQRLAVPLKRDGWISEMGQAVVYFASEAGAYTTGAFLRLDGGLGIGKYSI